MTLSLTIKNRVLAVLFVLALSIILFHQPEASNRPWHGNVSREVDRLKVEAPNLSRKVLRLALTAYSHVSDRGLARKPYLTVIDYSIASDQKRLWIFDLDHNDLAYNTYVAHGKGSGGVTAEHFSNSPGSRASSLGVFVTENTYYGHDGYSLRLDGLDKGFNSNAESRDIVIHGAWYVEKSFISEKHRAGLSWGCPAVPKDLARPLINTIKDGSVVFAYYPDNRWLSHSAYLT